MSARRVLLVDDEVALREAIADSLRMRGYWVCEAGKATEAETAVREQFFDVLITDIRLGEDDGLSLARRVRALEPRTALIFITGYGSLDLAIGAMRIGAADFLKKPFRLSALAEALDRIERVEETAEASCDAGADDAGGSSEFTAGASDADKAAWALREILWAAPASVDEPAANNGAGAASGALTNEDNQR